MAFTDPFIRRPVLATVVSLLIVLLGLQAFSAVFTKQTHLLMAASALMLIPPVLLFFFAQKLFIQGVVVSGIKG